MAFLKYVLMDKENRLVLLADNGNQLRDSLFDYSRRYKLHLTMPPESALQIVDKVHLNFEGIFVKDKERIQNIQILEDLVLSFHIGSYDYILEIANWNDSEKNEQFRAGLYKIRPISVSVAPFFYVSPKIINGVKNHDWKQYEERVKDMLRFRDASLDKLEKEGILYRGPRN